MAKGYLGELSVDLPRTDQQDTVHPSPKQTVTVVAQQSRLFAVRKRKIRASAAPK